MSDPRSLAGAIQGTHTLGAAYPSASDDVGPCATDPRREWVIKVIASATDEEMEVGLAARAEGRRVRP